MAEIATNAGDGVHELSDEALYAHCVEGLSKMGMVDAGAINSKAIHRTKFAGVVRTFDYATHLKTVLDHVSSLGIVSVGRNAEFEYIGMDEALRRSLEVVMRIDREWPFAAWGGPRHVPPHKAIEDLPAGQSVAGLPVPFARVPAGLRTSPHRFAQRDTRASPRTD